MIPIEHILVGTAVFLIVGVAASKIAVKAGVPALLLFLLLGMLAGSDGPGGIYFDNPWLAQSVGVVALVFILFSGGLDTRWADVRPVALPGLLLATIGVVTTALAVGGFTVMAFGFSWGEGILLGAIISSTDAAAVFAVLRGKGVQLKGRLKPVLELESGSNDPMAVFLTIGMIQLITQPDQSPLALVPMFVLQMGLGALVGVGAGWGLRETINRLRLEFDGLYPVLTTAGVLLTYGLTTSLGGNGFLAVYLAGLVMGRRPFIHRRSLTEFHDGLAWLMQLAMFITLGLQVFPSRLPGVAVTGLAVAAFLILVARPVSVFIALAFSRFRFRERLFIAWVGLRGAAPIILATFPLVAGIQKAETYFHLVFFIVLASVLLQGTLLIPAAKLLRVYSGPARPARSPLAYVMQDGILSNDLIEVCVDDDAPAVGRQILDLHLPAGVLVALIGRESGTIVPSGSTVIQAGDQVLLVVRRGLRGEISRLFQTEPAVNGEAGTRTGGQEKA
jgi:cell volume regulation protein A